jgi:hypothetical protein
MISRYVRARGDFSLRFVSLKLFVLRKLDCGDGLIFVAPRQFLFELHRANRPASGEMETLAGFLWVFGNGAVPGHEDVCRQWTFSSSCVSLESGEFYVGYACHHSRYTATGHGNSEQHKGSGVAPKL